MIRKGFLCTLLFVIQCGVAEAQVLDEGCDVLANIVQRSIAARTRLATPRRTHSEFALYRCAATAATATAAFTESMRQMRIPVRWESPGIAPGDVCLSHDISQCYPRSDSLPDSGFPGSGRLVRDSWNAIHSSLQLTIQQSYAPDVSFFQTGTLEHTVRYQLGTMSERAGRFMLD